MSRRKTRQSERTQDRERDRDHDRDEPDDAKAKSMTYYEVLGVAHDSVLPEIKKQFRKLAVRYHPDQRDTGDASIFALVARAYECLSSEQKRAEYDSMLAIERKARRADFLTQRKAFEEFIKAQETDVSAKSLENATAKFRVEFDDLDRKRGIDRNKFKEDPISSTDAVKRMKDMEMEREQDEIEFTQPKIFDDPLNFDRDKFNVVFEKLYKQDKEDQLVKHTGLPSAFNDGAGASFISCERNYDDLFDEGETVTGTGAYGTVSEFGKKVSVSRDDIEKVKSRRSDYKTHNSITPEYSNDIERRLRERESEDRMFDARKIQDFETDTKMDGFTFLHEVGVTGRELEWEKEEIDEETVKKLLAYRQEEEQTPRRKPRKQ